MATSLASLAREIVHDFETTLYGQGTVELVERPSVKVPLATVCHMMGLPEADWHEIHRWTDALLDNNRRWALPGESRYDMRKRLHAEFHAYICGVIERKRAEPGDDLSSMLVNADIDGRVLTEQELHGYLRLLVTAGNETTRNAMLLMSHPDQVCASGK